MKMKISPDFMLNLFKHKFGAECVSPRAESRVPSPFENVDWNFIFTYTQFRPPHFDCNENKLISLVSLVGLRKTGKMPTTNLIRVGILLPE